jgi:hypothetical protein
VVNRTWIEFCDTTIGNEWQTGNTNRILTLRDAGLLARSWLAVRFFNVACFNYSLLFAMVITVCPPTRLPRTFCQRNER